MEGCISHAVRNAKFGTREADVLHRAEAAIGQQVKPRDIIITVDIVPAKEEEIEEPDADPGIEAPEDEANEEEEEDNPDNATYDPNEDGGDEDDDESVPSLGSKEDSTNDEDADNKEERRGPSYRPIARSRRGRAVRRPDRLNLLITGKIPGVGGGMDKTGKMPGVGVCV